MNILPKKSWHVLSKDNIQRVRRDEAAAKAQEEEKQQRAALAEREAQLTLMRKRAREREGISKDQPTSTSSQSDRHVNFFSDIQQGVGVQLSNKDHDQEVAQEKESFEKRIGLLNYLVDKSKSDDPWYVTNKKTEESKKSHHRKELMDPLNDMKKYLGVKRKSSEVKSLSLSSVEKRRHLEAPPESSDQSSSSSSLKASTVEHCTKSSSHHKHKKHKHKSERKDKEKEARLEKLRKDRLKREAAEKLKSEAVLKHHYGVSQESEQPTASVDNSEHTRPRKYNSQFNPSLARY